MSDTCFDSKKGEFQISWPNSISRHDPVYKSPPSDPMQYGMPIGNGDIGALLWCDDRRIYIALNKCDLWDDAAFESFHNWSSEEEEYSSVLRHGCRIILDFSAPIFDTFYLNDFNGRISLKNGCIQLGLDTPFGSLSLEAFIAYNSNVLCLRGETEFAEPLPLTVTLERYGSRSFSHWYSFHRRDTSIGLTGTDSSLYDGALALSHKLTTGDFHCALLPIGDGCTPKRRSSHEVFAEYGVCPRYFGFYATVTSPFDNGSVCRAVSDLKSFAQKGWDGPLSENEACWKEFWSRSFVETEDDYLDNLWHLAMYYSCSGQRGSYPGRFINSLWNWNRDVQNWAFYFHWNQQEVYWGLNAAGHHELCDSYLNYRFNGMEYAKKDAKRLFGVENGLFVSDVCDRRGCNSEGEKHNHTPVGEIALDFWRQYQYTGDKKFLREKALPYMLGAAEFFASRFEKGDDGKYHAVSGTAYEGCALFYDCITELAMANALFRAVSSALDAAGEQNDAAARYMEIAENLAPIKTLDADERIVGDDGKIRIGMFNGRPVDSKKVFSIGRLTEGEPDWLKEYMGQYIPQWHYRGEAANGKATLDDGVDVLWESLHRHSVPSVITGNLDSPGSHPQACMAPVFPMNTLGLKDRGTPEFDTAVTTALTCREKQLTGWDTTPIVMARLGLTDAVDKYLDDFPSCWQYYNNGFGHYGPSCVMVPDMMSPFRRDILRDAEDSDSTFRGETFPFRHMGLEPLGVFSAAMNERLLQSWDGVIRLVPAYGAKNGKFKLHAVGGFVVMCQIEKGVPLFVAIRSLRGERLTLENPWEKAQCNDLTFEDRLISMDTHADRLYVFTPAGSVFPEFRPSVPAENTDCKIRPDGRTMLGLARSF